MLLGGVYILLVTSLGLMWRSVVFPAGIQQAEWPSEEDSGQGYEDSQRGSPLVHIKFIYIMWARHL